jgi:TP901 family phage tail tape measure protein
MDAAARKTREFSADSQLRLAQQREAYNVLGRTAFAVGAVALAAVGIAIKKYADFDQAISNVAAVTQETTENMGLLTEAALEAGGRTVFTALEAANAIEELGKAGISTADILGGALDGALSLAASGQLEVARAAEITATTLKQYGLAGDQAGRVADVLSAAAGKALGSVEDLAQGLKFVGPVAASMGVSIEETAGALALFADQGLVGEQAGTSLRGVLSSLTSPSAQASEAINTLGINLYDLKTNKFLGLENVAGQLSTAFGKLDEKQRDYNLGLIFGNQQITAARVLFAGGAEAIAKYTAEVNDAGYAARVAADRMNNLKGDVEKLGGALDTALIRSGSGANDVLRRMVQSTTFLIDEIGDLPQPVLDAALAVGTIGGSVSLAAGAALLAVPKIAAFNAALATTELNAKRVTVALGTIGVIIGLAGAKVQQEIERQASLAEVGDQLAASLDKATGAYTAYSREIVANDLVASGAAKTAQTLGIDLDTLTDAAFGNVAAMRELQAATDKLAGGGTGGAFQNVRDLRTQVAGLRGEVEGAPDEMRDLAAATDDSADSYQAAASEVAAMESELSGLIDTINRVNGLGQDAIATNAAYEAGLAKATATVSEYVAANGQTAASIDESTAAGSANAAMFADLAEKSQDAAKAQFDLDGNSTGYIANLEAGRQALFDQIEGLTGSADAAQLLTDKIYALPTAREVEIIADTANAQAQLDRFIRLNNGRSVRVNVGAVNGPGFADGGFTGPGPRYAVAGFVHAGEYVSDARTTSIPANRAVLEYMHAGGTIGGFAGGGFVSPPQYATAAAPAIYVQNPWTGEYLLARAAQVAYAAVDDYGGGTAVDVNAGGLA